VLTQAFRWLCRARAHYYHNDDVWHVRYWWARQKLRLQAQLRTGTYRLSECRLVRGRERTSEIWCVMDALALKALAIVLMEHLQPWLSRRCFKVAGKGWRKDTVLALARQTVKWCVARISQLYEQGAATIRIRTYVRRRWAIWVRVGLGGDAGWSWTGNHVLICGWT